MIADFGKRISNCKRRIKREHGLRSDFGDRVKVMSKKFLNQFSSHFSIDLKSTLRNLQSAIVTGAMLFALCFAAEAQPVKIFRIGYLDPSTASGSAVLLDAFRQELSKLGWIEGKNITIEYRFAEQKAERVPELAADLVRLKADLIVVSGTSAALAAK